MSTVVVGFACAVPNKHACLNGHLQTRNELMKSTTADTMQLFVSLLDLGPGGAKGTTAADEYIHELATMTKGLPPLSLVATGATEAIISDGL
jgi:hypothetical protein